MEQTLGKRIIENRKRLGLTQDRLAEQLGVTAQAVSKWENDQSCPDITMLPKLAEIFSISTDALLGIETVHEAEVVNEAHSNHLHVDHNDGLWEFKYDGGRKAKLGMALWILLMGGLLLVVNVRNTPADLWDIAWPSAVLLFGLWGLFPRFSFFRLGCAFLGGYNLLNNLQILPYHLDKQLLLPVFLLLFGGSVLVDALKTKKKPGFVITHNGKTVHSGVRELTSDASEGEDSFDYSLSFGTDTRHVALPRLASGNADVSFGELTVDMTAVGEFSDNCYLDADCAFGHLVIRLPKSCRAIPSTDTAFASVKISGSPDPQPLHTIKMDCDVAFGAVQIQYV